MNDKNENIIKGEVKVGRVLYPKKGDVVSHDFKIISVIPKNIEEGKVEESSYGNFVIKGNAPEIKEGETYQIILKEDVPNEYGKQYNIMYIGNPIDCDDKKSQKIFLEKVLGESKSEVLYETLEDPFQAIVDEDIESLTKCKGIGEKTALKLIKQYKSNINYSKAYVELDKYGLTQYMVNRLVERYGSPDIAIEKINSNPYILADEVDGVGFKKADEIALRGGVEKDSEFRIQSFIRARLKECAENGHSYIHPSELFKTLVEVLELDLNDIKDKLVAVLKHLKDSSVIWYDKDRTMMSLDRIKLTEEGLSNELMRVKNGVNDFRYADWKKVIDRTEENQGWEFTSQQIDGIESVLKNQVTVITGKGGTGKSTLVTGVLDVLYKEHGHSFAQCALAGRAGARLAEITGEQGYTIHRLLEYNPMERGFKRNEKLPLEQDIIIVDEISMIGADLFYDLLKAIKDGAKLILLGDIAQLSSIGVGNVAKDIIDSGMIKVVELTEIHRQAKKSAIITEGIKVADGQQLVSSSFRGVETRGELQDLTLDVYSEKEETVGKVVKYFKEKLTDKNIMELQVITSMRFSGDSSVFDLNNKLQAIYNPPSDKKDSVEVSLRKGKVATLREGDKVMNVKNNYDTETPDGKEEDIYNGDIGVILEIDKEFEEMIIEFERIGDVVIPFDIVKNIELAYAITAHKSQGSQYDKVIMALDYSSYIMLSKEMTYTGMSRAKVDLTMVVQNSALAHSIRTSKTEEKRTFLKHFLRGEINE